MNQRKMRGQFIMNYKLLIFDLDGTILNTLEDLCSSTNYALQAHNFPTRTIEEVRKFVGNGIQKLIERAVPSGTSVETIEQVLQTFKEHYAIHCADNTSPYDGIMELLTTLRAKGCLTAVVSNKADFAVQSLCKDYFPDMFDFVVGEREGIRRKPYPDSVEEVLKKLQIEKEQAVYIGDSDVDIQTAANSGLQSIIVKWGFRDEAFLRKHGAKIIVDKPSAILSFIE